jgi:DNA-binding MarR family transcriptional regulator
MAVEPLSRVAPLVSRWVERLLAGHDPSLTLAQHLALHAVTEGELVGSELARRSAVSPAVVSPAAVSQLLANLEDAGLLERARSADDRRRHDLTLSPSGQAACAPRRRCCAPNWEHSSPTSRRPRATRSRACSRRSRRSSPAPHHHPDDIGHRRPRLQRSAAAGTDNRSLPFF